MSRIIKTMNELPLEVRKKMTDMLQKSLAASMDLYTQAKQAHWNVRGPRFNTLHLLFDSVAEAVLPFSDEIAERAGQLGGEVNGTLRQAAAASPLKEYPLGIAHGEEHLHAIATSFAAYAKMIHDNIDAADDAGDKTTADLFTEISRAVDLKLWFIESHFELDETESKSEEKKSKKVA